MLLQLVVLATLASVHGASWQHRNLRATLWPLAFQPVPDFTDSQGQDVDPQIVGGEDAAEHEFPHQVSMQIEGRPYRTQHICGGTILAPSWVLTAAHCAWGVPEYTAVFVLAGKNNLAMVEQGQQRSYVSDMYAHAQYRTNWNHGVGPFDVALLKLLTPLTFSDTVKPAKLPARDQVPSGNAQLSGWGSISKLSTITIPDKLQKAVFPIIPFKECSEFIGEMSPDEVNPVRDTNICIGDLHQAGLSSCQGDSGGPLIQVDQSTKEVTVIGITSWGFTPCGRTPAPSVFTRVSAFIDWIEERAPELKQP